jgi:hypothetical protein
VVQFTDEALRAVIDGYEAEKTQALRRRDERLREFHEQGWRPVDIQRVTGYSRETIRQALHPDVRRATNNGRRKATAVPGVRRPGTDATRIATAPPSRPAGGYATYGSRKPYSVADRLEDLRGPTSGTVTLPKHMDWSGSAAYDLDKPARLASLYRTVLNEASCTDDLQAFLDGRTLMRLWATLYLPPAVRQLWENRFPELAAIRAGAA